MAVSLLLCLWFVWRLEGVTLRRGLLVLLALLRVGRMLLGCAAELAGRDRERARLERSNAIFRQSWSERQIILFQCGMTTLGVCIRLLLPICLYLL